MMTKERSTKIVNFMTPGAEVLELGRNHFSYIVKKHCFYKLLPGIDQTNYVYSYDDQVIVLGRYHISHKVKMHYSYKNLLLYSQALIRQTIYIVIIPMKGLPKLKFS